MKKKYLQHLFTLLLVISAVLFPIQRAQSQIYSAGDIIFTGYDATFASGNPAAADRFSFIVMRDVSHGTILYFTDRGYFNSQFNAAGFTEGTIRFEIHGVHQRGTEFYIDGLTASVGGSFAGYVSLISGGNPSSGLNLAATGDQIIAFANHTGDPTTPNTSFVAGIHWGPCQSASDNSWDTSPCVSNGSNSSMPPGLVGGQTAFYVGNPGTGAYTQASYNGAGSPFAHSSATRVALMNKNLWNKSVSTASQLSVPAGVSIARMPEIYNHPANYATCAGDTATFSVTAFNSPSTYIWQVNTGSGYTNLSNSAIYSNVSTPTLTITGVPSTFNGYLYRCKASNNAGSVDSNGATLSVVTITTSGTQENINCNGGNNGSATVSATGGSGNFTYNWAPYGGSGATASSLIAGTYTVTITDSNNCNTTREFLITEPDAFISEEVVGNVTCHNGTNGSANVSVFGGTAPYTYVWSTPLGSGNTANGLSAGSYTVDITDSKGCTATRNFTISQPSALIINSSQSNVSCYNGSNGTASLNVLGGSGNYTYNWSPGNPNGDGTSSVSGLTAGTWTVTVTDGNGCTASKNIVISQPSQIIPVGSQTNATCAQNNGTASVSVTGGSGYYSYAWFPAGGNSATASNLSPGSYICFVFDTNGCSASKSFVITDDAPTTWNGSNWNNGYPTLSKMAIISGDYSSTGDLQACSLIVNNNAVVTVNTGHDFLIDRKIDVQSGSLTFKDRANLLQNNSSTTNSNTGIITSERAISLKRLDYVFWGSPVIGQDLKLFSPETVSPPVGSSRFYNYSEGANAFVKIDEPSGVMFAAGKGYMLRSPNNLNPNPNAAPEMWTAKFKGIPNNGNYTVNITNTPVTGAGFNMLSNPYPSPINADLFLAANPGTLYFWTHQDQTAEASHYAVYNSGTGGVQSGTITPTNVIQTGQGFLFQTESSNGIATFTNAMRTGNNDGVAFRTAEERHRFWLTLSDSNNPLLSQTLIGYVNGATDGFDESFDGRQLHTGSALSSLIANDHFVIQGRALPFNNSDIVPLAFKAETEGVFTISLSQFDGLFESDQAILIKDKLTGNEHNLKNGAYNFASLAGSFANRFDIVFQTTLGVENPIPDANSIVIYKDNKVFNINSGTTVMSSVKVFDISGRLLYEKDKINAMTTSLNNLKAANQVLLIHITTDTNQVITKKVIN